MADLAKTAAYASQADKAAILSRGFAQQAAGFVSATQRLKGDTSAILTAAELVLERVRNENNIALDYEWNGTQLRLRKPDGSWGVYVNLLGPASPASVIASAAFSGVAAITVQAALEEIYAESARLVHAHVAADITDLTAAIDAVLATLIGGTLPADLDTILEITTAIGVLQTAVSGKQNALGFTPENAAAKGQASGYAGLGGDGKVPTAQLPDAVLGALKYQGTWDASTNSPTIPAAAAGNKGWYRLVTTAGSTALDGITDWKVGDWLVSDGATWSKIDNTDAVISVAGLVGVITDVALKAALAMAISDVAGLQTALDARHLTTAIASAAEFCAGTDNDKRPTSKTIADALAPSSIAFSSSLTLDLATRKDFEIGNLTANLTLANFNNKKPGDRGVIQLKQDGSGNRTLGVGSQFVKLGGGALATAASAVTLLSYVVWDAATVYYTLTRV